MGRASDAQKAERLNRARMLLRASEQTEPERRVCDNRPIRQDYLDYSRGIQTVRQFENTRT
jgi:hypothetical protein